MSEDGQQKRIKFIEELQSLLRKYDCYIDAKDHWEGYSECGEDIRITVEFSDWWISDIDLGSSFRHDENIILDGEQS